MPPDPPACRVPGCQRKSGPQKYLIRYRVCHGHSILESVELDGRGPVRWCQQCRKFHELDQFDGNRKSCRKALSQHNSRRSKRRRGGTTPSSDSSGTSRGGTASPMHSTSHGSSGTGGSSEPESEGAVGRASGPPQQEAGWATAATADSSGVVPTSFAEAFHAGAAAAAILAGHLGRSSGFKPYTVVGSGDGDPSGGNTVQRTRGSVMEANSPPPPPQVDSPIMIEAPAGPQDLPAAAENAAGLQEGSKSHGTMSGD